MVKKYHPDVNKTEEANKIIVSLNEAKETLLNEEKRKEYDLLLNEIQHSKQFSKNEKETYSAKTQAYKERYAQTYVTKWQFFRNYLRNGRDNLFIKIIKSLFVTINYLLFFVIKTITMIIVLLISFLGSLIDFIAGLVMVLGFLALFTLSGDMEPNYIPFLPANVEMFLFMGIISVGIELIKLTIIKGTINLFAVFKNIEDTIFVKILTK